MKHLKKFNEAIIDYKGENIDGFYNDMKASLNTPGSPAIGGSVYFANAVKIGEKNGIDVVDYDTFYNELPDHEKPTAPPRGAQVFALADPMTKRPRVVLGVKKIDKRLLDFIYHMLKHENIHVGQHSKRLVHKKNLPDPTNRKSYYSDYDEVMAYSQSVTDMLINQEKVKSVEDGINKLDRIPLYQEIKRNVDSKTLKRYHKYIYLYLEKEFKK